MMLLDAYFTSVDDFGIDFERQLVEFEDSDEVAEERRAQHQDTRSGNGSILQLIVHRLPLSFRSSVGNEACFQKQRFASHFVPCTLPQIEKMFRMKQTFNVKTLGSQRFKAVNDRCTFSYTEENRAVAHQ
jgi:hypothetical protein